MKIFLTAIVIFVHTLFGQTDSVAPIGPSGGIITLLEGSLDDKVVFAAVRDVGLYRSADGGESWLRVSLPLSAMSNGAIDILDFAFHPLNADSILMATSAGLFGSGDGGTTWNQINTFPMPRLSVEYVPANPAIVFGSDENGVLRSTDGGKSWMPMKDNQYFGNRMVQHIAIHPSDVSNIRLVATTGFDDTTGIFLSTNGGVNWSPFNKNLPAGLARHIYAVEMDSTGLGINNFRVFVGTAQGMYGAQTDQSESSFVAIENKNTPVTGVITGGVLVYDKFDTTVSGGEHQFAFYYASNGSEYDGTPQLYTKNNGVFKISSVKGTIITLSPLSPPPVVRVFGELSDITSIHVPTQSNKLKVYLGTTNGIFISYDGGVSWQQKNNGVMFANVRNLEMMSVPNVGTLLYSSVYGGGVSRSSDEGHTWLSANNGIGNPYITTVKVDNNRKVVYAGSGQGLYGSIDGGSTWTTLIGIDSTMVRNASRYSAREDDATVRISPVNSDNILFYTPASGLLLSSNAGATWKEIASPYGIDTTHVPENIEFDPVDPQTIYYAGQSFFKSGDMGATWTDISSNLPKYDFLPGVSGEVGLEILSPAINPKNTNEIFVSTVYDIQHGPAFRLFKTTNGGQSWDPLTKQIPAYDAEYDRIDPQRVIASGPFGIARTTDGGISWKMLTDTASLFQYYLLGSHPSDPNIVFAGSEHGGQKISLGDYPHVAVDTLMYDFGKILLGSDSVKSIRVNNTAGQRSVLLTFQGLSNASAFHYGDSSEILLAPGEIRDVPVRFKPSVEGKYSAILKFTTSDAQFDTIRFVLTGIAYSRNTIEKFSYDFGSVTVGKDSVLSIDIDNTYGTQPIGISFLGNSDSLSFHYLGSALVIVDTGNTVSLSFQFTPKSRGEKTAYALFSTTDPRFQSLKLGLQGVGISRNLVSRNVLIDSDVGFTASDGSTTADYFKLLQQSLDRAGINVDMHKVKNYSAYDAAVYIQPNGPPPADVIDSLQRYVVNGGILIAIGDAGSASQAPFNTLLADSNWMRKYGITTGVRFNSNMLIDTSSQGAAGGDMITAYPFSRTPYTYNVDTIALRGSGSLHIDSTVHNALPLLYAQSASLFSEDYRDSVVTFEKINAAIVAAVQTIGKGKIIAIADYDIWSNGFPDDSLRTAGLLAADNLRFALNLFGSIDNLLTKLPEPTPQEEYKIISIPYTFADSSVTALFKDLGPANELNWRMFGRWNESKKSYEEFPNDFKAIRRGEGYWLITKQPTAVDFGTTTVQGTEEDFKITLRPGYNLIGNPFPYAVSWLNSVKGDSVEKVLWKFDKAFDTTSSVMEPFRGYFVNNRAATARTIVINSEQVISASSSLGKINSVSQYLQDNEWKIQLKAHASGVRDEQNFIGMLRTSSAQYDENDFSKPPMSPGEYVAILLKNGNEYLAADYRPISESGDCWDFVLASSKPNEPVTVSLEPFGNLPPQFGVYLVDFTTERITDLTYSRSATVSLQKKEASRAMRLIVGNSDFLQKNSAGIPLVPLQYSLGQNFPNPFNPATTIMYSLSHSAMVRLDVFNVLGQKVKAIVDAFQPIGEYAVRWDGTNNFGQKAASGIYYYRIQANEFSASKKMTLIK